MLINNKFLFAGKSIFLSLLIVFILPVSLTAESGQSAVNAVAMQPVREDVVSADEMARQALKDSLYYRYEKWLPAFKALIAVHESTPKDVDTLLELMKCHFYYSVLHVDHSHVLAVTQEYMVPELAEMIVTHLSEAKKIAEKILKNPEATNLQRAEAYLYLGGSEGYLGIFEFDRGNFITALLNGLQADNHLEEALRLDPNKVEAHFGLGTYRYTNSRLGGLGN
ncbi:MAG: hypothetical protein ACE5EK_06530, partial [Nitrospinales bacterium]